VEATAAGLAPNSLAERRSPAVVVAIVALASVSSAALGIARTLITNGTGYLTVGGRILDAQESVGLLGLPGTLLPALAALLLLSTEISRSRQPLVAVAALALAVGQFLPSASGARSTGRAFADFTARRLPLDISVASTVFGLAIVLVLVAAAAERDRELVLAISGAAIFALTITLGFRSAGTAFRWRGGPDTSVTVGLWVSLAGALAVAVIGATRRRPLPVAAYGVLGAVLAAGAALLAG
jgi:hypothetical protein